MAAIIPPYQNYGNPIFPVPSRERMLPGQAFNSNNGQEPLQFAPVLIDWNNWSEFSPPAIQVDLGQRCTRPFTQLIMMDVDNSYCSVDVMFMFPDTGLTKTVPAGENARFFTPTNNVRFFAVCVQAPLSTDTTQMVCLNYASLPNDISKTEFNTTAAVGGIDLTTAASIAIVAAPTDGIISDLTIAYDNVGSGATAGAAQLHIEDGTANILAMVSIGAPANTMVPTAIGLAIMQAGRRFSDGLNAVVTLGTPALNAGFATINVGYRMN